MTQTEYVTMLKEMTQGVSVAWCPQGKHFAIILSGYGWARCPVCG